MVLAEVLLEGVATAGGGEVTPIPFGVEVTPPILALPSLRGEVEVLLVGDYACVRVEERGLILYQNP